jgi:hypothetical protein
MYGILNFGMCREASVKTLMKGHREHLLRSKDKHVDWSIFAKP